MKREREEEPETLDGKRSCVEEEEYQYDRISIYTDGSCLRRVEIVEKDQEAGLQSYNFFMRIETSMNLRSRMVRRKRHLTSWS